MSTLMKKGWVEIGPGVGRCLKCQGTSYITNLQRSGCDYCGSK